MLGVVVVVSVVVCTYPLRMIVSSFVMGRGTQWVRLKVTGLLKNEIRSEKNCKRERSKRVRHMACLQIVRKQGIIN